MLVKETKLIKYKPIVIYLFYTVKTQLIRPCPYNPLYGYSGMPQCSGTHLLTRLVHHATLNKSGPIPLIPETTPRHLLWVWWSATLSDFLR